MLGGVASFWSPDRFYGYGDTIGDEIFDADIIAISYSYSYKESAQKPTGKSTLQHRLETSSSVGPTMQDNVNIFSKWTQASMLRLLPRCWMICIRLGFALWDLMFNFSLLIYLGYMCVSRALVHTSESNRSNPPQRASLAHWQPNLSTFEEWMHGSKQRRPIKAPMTFHQVNRTIHVRSTRLLSLNFLFFFSDHWKSSNQSP